MARRSVILGLGLFGLISVPPGFAQIAAEARPAPDLKSAFSREIETLERRHGGRLGLAALDTADGAILEHRGDERFALCSTFKLLLAAAVAARIDQNEESWTRKIEYGEADLLEWSPVTGKAAPLKAGSMTIDELCAAAIRWSDNTAANLLLTEIGGPAGLTRFLRAIGDPFTRLDRIEPDLNDNLPDDPRDTTRPAVMLATMGKILRGDVLSPASRHRITNWMLENQTGEKRIRAGMDSGWRTGDKTGTGPNGAVSDVAIIFPPDREPLLLVIYYTGSEATPAQREKVVAEAAEAIRETLVPVISGSVLK